MSEGSTIPGDCQLICDYNTPQDYEEFKKLKEQEKFDNGPEVESSGSSDKEKGGKAAEEDEEDDASVHYGNSLIACGKLFSSRQNFRKNARKLTMI